MNSISNYSTLLEQVKAGMPDIEPLFRQLFPGRPAIRRGSRIWTSCVFHDERTASLMFDTITNRGHCFGCGWHDDAMGFWLKVNGLEMRNGGLKALAEWLGIPVTQSPEARQAARQAIAERRERTELAATAKRLIRETRQHYSHLERAANGILRLCPPKTEADLDRPWVIWAMETKDNAEHVLDLLQGMTEEEAVEYALLLRKEGLCGF